MRGFDVLCVVTVDSVSDAERTHHDFPFFLCLAVFFSVFALALRIGSYVCDVKPQSGSDFTDVNLALDIRFDIRGDNAKLFRRLYLLIRYIDVIFFQHRAEQKFQLALALRNERAEFVRTELFDVFIRVFRSVHMKHAHFKSRVREHGYRPFRCGDARSVAVVCDDNLFRVFCHYSRLIARQRRAESCDGV